MIQVLLLILKIIGITLASILGFVLFVLLVVLFVPIRYRARVIYKPEHLEVIGRVSFLFSLLSVTVRYLEKLTYKGRLFGFVFLNSEKKKKEKEKKPKNKKKQSKEEKIEQKEEIQLPEQVEQQKQEEPILVEEEKIPESLTQEQEEPTWDDVLEEVEQEEAKEADTKDKLSFFEKISLKISQIRETIDNVIAKVRKIWHQKEEVQKILEKSGTKRALSFVFGKVIKILRHILPRKLKGYLIFGSGDPATTGKVLAVLGIVYAKTGPLIEITPNFVEKQLECDLEIEGKIQIIVLVVIAVQVILNKDVRRLMKDVKNIKNVQ